jgi:hypothetical protein
LDAAVDAFEQALADWEFSEQWRPVVARLAERARDWPIAALSPRDFWIQEASESPSGHPCDGLLVWTDVVHPTRNAVEASIGGQFDLSGLRVGHLQPHNPGGYGEVDDFAWIVRAHDGLSLCDQADRLIEWLSDEAQRWLRHLEHAAG